MRDWAIHIIFLAFYVALFVILGVSVAVSLLGWRQKMVRRSDERLGDECVSNGRLDDISERVGGFLGKAVRGVLGMWRPKRGKIPHDVIESRIDKKGAQVKTNKTQDYVLFACGAVIVLMLLFPPFHHGNWNDGYGFLFDPPKRGMVNTGMLLTQWLCVAIIGGILLFVLRDKK